MISTLVWSYGGFDQMGSLAGEVKGGSRTYILGVIGSFPFIQLNYLSPVMAGWLILPDRSKWQAGAFHVVADQVSNWFADWILAAACVSSFASYVTGLPPVARNVWAMAKGLEGVQSLPGFLGWSWNGQPIAGLLFTCLISWILAIVPILACFSDFESGIQPSMFPLPFNSFNHILKQNKKQKQSLSFNYLVQVYLVVRLANLFIEFLSLLKLRYSEPNRHRPFKIGCGWAGVIAITLPTFLIGIFALATMDVSSLAVGGATVGCVVLLYGVVWSVQQFSQWCSIPGYGEIEEGYVRERLSGQIQEESAPLLE